MPEKLREGMSGFKDRQMRRFSLPTSSRGLLKVGVGAGAGAAGAAEPRRSSVASVCSTECRLFSTTRQCFCFSCLSRADLTYSEVSGAYWVDLDSPG